MKLPNQGWLNWSFDGVPFSIRTSKDQTFELHIKKSSYRFPFYRELYENAKAMRDYYDGTFDVLLSGGIDSEVVVRSFKDLKITHNTFIFSHELNQVDVNEATELCKSLNIPYKILDFNLKKFYEQDAYDLYKASGCIRAGRVHQLRYVDLLDNIPVIGDGEPYWKKTDAWRLDFSERDKTISIYTANQNRDAICWYDFSPQLLHAYNQLPIIQKLITNQIPGKQSSWSSRFDIFKELWPIKKKPKLTGLEGDNLPGSMPKYVQELQEQITREIGSGTDCWYTYDELKTIL